MNKSRTLLMALAIVGISSGAASAEPTVETFKTKGKGLQAAFTMGDNCQAAFTTVTFAEAVLSTNGVQEIQHPLIFLDIDYVNACTDVHLILTGYTEDVQAQISGDLSRARVFASVPVADESGTQNATITVNLTFAGSGPLTTVADHSTSREGNVVMKSNFSFQSRTAEARGTIAGNLPADGPYTNLTQGPSSSASIGQSRTGNITITRNH